jgi:hypothetical protein
LSKQAAPRPGLIVPVSLLINFLSLINKKKQNTFLPYVFVFNNKPGFSKQVAMRPCLLKPAALRPGKDFF